MERNIEQCFESFQPLQDCFHKIDQLDSDLDHPEKNAIIIKALISMVLITFQLELKIHQSQQSQRIFS